MNKFKDFPPVYYITLKDSVDRQEKLEQYLNSQQIRYTKIIAFDGRKHDFANDPCVVGLPQLQAIDSGHIATALSHIKAIECWYYTNNTSTAIFLEDDMNLELSNYWTFTWPELMTRLNTYYWSVLQLSLLRGQDAETALDEHDMCFRRRSFYNWSVGAYMITRGYAKRLLELYTGNGKYTLIVDRWPEYYPYVENLIYIAARPHEFTLPLFVEDVSFNSTFYPHFITTQRKTNQLECSIFVQAWWQNVGSKTTIDELMHWQEARYWEISGTPSGWEIIRK